ncbi:MULTISPECIES: hypothetical protein [Aurantimonas]|uniref:hypothetical protein n=1 Tax=Aurantimonas TaxID=182269 RepID=UPI0035164C0D
MNSLRNLFSGLTISDDGRSYVDPVLADFLTVDVITGSRELPGFIEAGRPGRPGVTYESHRFWVHQLAYGRDVDSYGADAEASGVLIVVRHGGGWEIWQGDSMLAEALAFYGDDDRGLFKLCWTLRDIARNARAAGHQEASTEYKKAFVDGRLKKRKKRGMSAYSVWIEASTKVDDRAA